MLFTITNRCCSPVNNDRGEVGPFFFPRVLRLFVLYLQASHKMLIYSDDFRISITPYTSSHHGRNGPGAFLVEPLPFPFWWRLHLNSHIVRLILQVWQTGGYLYLSPGKSVMLKYKFHMSACPNEWSKTLTLADSHHCPGLNPGRMR